MILRYSSDNKVPLTLAEKQLEIEEKRRKKHEFEEIKGAHAFAHNNAAAYSMSIEAYRAEIEKLRKANRQLRLEIPALQA